MEKVHQSAPSCIYLCLYKDGKHANLILSVSASRPMIAVTESEIAKPQDPTPLCMLLRKHLQNGRITAVDCVPHERIVRFSFESADELGFLKEKSLYVEMMGKYSNLILVNEDGKIAAATFTSDLTASARQVMLGMPYQLPPAQEKFDALQISEMEFYALLSVNQAMTADKFFVSKFFSFSPVVAREIVFRATGRVDSLVSDCDGNKLWTVFSEILMQIKTGTYQPEAIYDGDKGIEYSFIHLTQYIGCTHRQYESLSALLLSYFSQKEEAVNLRSYASDILKVVHNLLAREEKKIGLQRQELADCGEREIFRKYGDLLMANLYRLKNSEPFAEVEDYETGETVRIRMDIRLTPSKNAQQYYKKYAKMKRAAEILREQIQLTEKKIDHLESILDSVDRAQEISDLEDIRRELSATGLTRDRNGAKNDRKKIRLKSSPLRYVTTDGKVVCVGRNNLQNDALDAAADKRDIWFHIKKFHGSHVILYTNGEEPTDRDYTEAAMLAAFHSEKKGSSNVEVDYTRVKYLRKPNGSAPGFVTYETYYSAVVDAKDPFEAKKEV